jgi:hypothetical protein
LQVSHALALAHNTDIINGHVGGAMLNANFSIRNDGQSSTSLRQIGVSMTKIYFNTMFSVFNYYNRFIRNRQSIRVK